MNPSPATDPSRCRFFRLKNRLEDLVPFNAQVNQMLARSRGGQGHPDAAVLGLILDELLTNVIKYGHPGDDSEHEIFVRLCLSDSGFRLDIEDDGVPFDPTAAPEKSQEELNLPVEERTLGGWGLALVRRSVDAVTYRRDEALNKLTLCKGIAPDIDLSVSPSSI